MNTPILARFHALIDGRVQGIGFRFFAQDAGNALGITGWVRNRFDGQVEVVAEGERTQLEGFLEQLRRGPRGAYITQLDVEWETASGEFAQFDVRRSI